MRYGNARKTFRVIVVRVVLEDNVLNIMYMHHKLDVRKAR